MNRAKRADVGRRAGPVFISYATADRKQALAVCESIESRGTPCWISSRDVPAGENYQEAIVQALRDARAMVLVFSKAANKSDEIKKELSLASRYHVPVIALRLQDVEPSDAFAYELSTRQWIDAFDGWDKAIDTLVGRVAQISGAKPGPAASTGPVHTRAALSTRHLVAIAAAAGMLVLLAVAGWWWFRPHAAAHSMTVRLAGFQTLSPDLPSTMRDALNSEISAAFNADGVIGVSTAADPEPGTAPAYALGGTVHRIGDSVRVITQFKNERTGTILWSDSVDYPGDQVAKIPHKVAVDAGIVVRCGLSGAATYRKPLPDQVLKDYMQYCEEAWAYGGTKTLLPAQRVVAALPDFSWGWSAVQTGFMQAAYDETDDARAEELKAEGLRAAAKALALDPRNSEALDRKTYLIDQYAWAEQESLYKAAIAAKPLDCGCEHYGYGQMLINVGRMNDAVDQFRAATDMLALWPDSQLALGLALVAVRRTSEAKDHFEAAMDLSKAPNFASWLALNVGPETGDYAAAITALQDTRLDIPDTSRAALLAGYRALAANDAQQKAKAVSLLVALPKEEQRDRVVVLLGALGASHEALQIAADRPWLFWRRSMRGVLNDPAFPAILQKLRLTEYWKQSRTKPDVCKESAQPSFCRSL